MSKTVTKIPTPVKAHRLKCLDCTSNQVSEIRQCEIYDCPVWLYRMGRRPTEEERKIWLTTKIKAIQT